MYRPGLSPLEIGIFPACGFRLFSRPHERWTDEALLAALGVSGREIPCDWPPSGVHAVSITEHGEWTHVNDAYGLWNSGRWRDAVRTLASAGDLFTFLLPDPDHSYRFAYYRSGSRVRLRVVHDGWWENGPLALLVDEGQPLPGEPEAWALEGFRVLDAIAPALGIDGSRVGPVRCYGWGSGGPLGP